MATTKVNDPAAAVLADFLILDVALIAVALLLVRQRATGSDAAVDAEPQGVASRCNPVLIGSRMDWTYVRQDRMTFCRVFSGNDGALYEVDCIGNRNRDGPGVLVQHTDVRRRALRRPD
jgi:hypothetical protein